MPIRQRTPVARSPADPLGSRTAMTTKRTSFGFIIPQRAIVFGAATWPDLLDLARSADQNPLFDSIWLGDSLIAKARPDPIPVLGALAAAVSRVRLGVGCMASFPLRDPVIFAAQWAALDLISNGRT